MVSKFELTTLLVIWAVLLIRIQSVTPVVMVSKISYPIDMNGPKDGPMADFVVISGLIKKNKSQELKEFLSKNATCQNKVQYKDYVDANVADRMRVRHVSLQVLMLTDMFNCPPTQVYATHMRAHLNYEGSTRAISEVLVTMSETTEIHDSFLKDYDANPSEKIGWTGFEEAGLKTDLEDALSGDFENVCFELKNRKRAPTGQVDPQAAAEAAKNLIDEMDHWSNKRGTLDSVMMETSFVQLRAIFDEFQKLNNGKSIEEAFAAKFQGDDADKLNTYMQLVQIARDKNMYFVNQINSSSGEIDELGLATPIRILQTVSKEDRKKIEDEYKKTYNISLRDQINKMIDETEMDAFANEVLKLYLDDLNDS